LTEKLERFELLRKEDKRVGALSRELKLIQEIKSCTVCKSFLPNKPNPVVSFSSSSKIVIIGQAPGIKVHKSGVPWDDASGERLRSWLNISKEQFYDTRLFGIVPMGFCYPGKGKSGDLPPRSECAELWMRRVLKSLKQKELVLLIGQYSQKYFLGDSRKPTLTETVKNWNEYLPDYFVLPHPSPRNNIWMKKNSWFEKKTVKSLRNKVASVIKI
jgi:uracil-DNA glycosylase